MHELALHFAHSAHAVILGGSLLAVESTPTPDNNTIKVAIVTALGVVIAAAITAIASTFQRERSVQATVSANDNYTRDYISGLVRDQKELRKVQHQYSLLREACWERRLDPDDLIREQERST